MATARARQARVNKRFFKQETRMPEKETYSVWFQGISNGASRGKETPRLQAMPVSTYTISNTQMPHGAGGGAGNANFDAVLDLTVDVDHPAVKILAAAYASGANLGLGRLEAASPSGTIRLMLAFQRTLVRSVTTNPYPSRFFISLSIEKLKILWPPTRPDLTAHPGWKIGK